MKSGTVKLAFNSLRSKPGLSLRVNNYNYKLSIYTFSLIKLITSYIIIIINIYIALFFEITQITQTTNISNIQQHIHSTKKTNHNNRDKYKQHNVMIYTMTKLERVRQYVSTKR